MVTAVGRSPPPGPGRLLYAQPILTVPGETRYAIVCRVGELAAALRALAAAHIRLEHVYDY